MKKIIIFVIFLPFFAFADDVKTKFYDFDDLLINGEYKKPQIMYNDTQAKVRFERLFRIKKNFVKDLIKTEKDPSLR
tara:strand:- start:311 stop:541 length:231 start_codon:yes stop_codon:yes gene_type:complete